MTDIEDINNNYKEEEPDNTEEGGTIDTIFKIISILAAIPLFLILSKVLPDPDWIINLDRILIFIASAVIVYLIACSFYIITLLGLLAGIVFLTYGSFASGDHYGWGNAVFDYKSLIHSIITDENEVAYIADNLLDIKTKEIKEMCDYKEPIITDSAYAFIDKNQKFINYADEHYQYRGFIHACAIYKYVNEKWECFNHHNDFEYYAKASKSVKILKGNEYDYTILMCSLIKAIGAETRIVITEKYPYPEIRIDKKNFNEIKYLIKNVLYKTDDDLNVNIDGDYIWLNMAYKYQYPGAKHLENNQKVSIINI